MEGVSVGFPMVTWPVLAKQFFNEKLVNQILRIGVAISAQQWARFVEDSINTTRNLYYCNRYKNCHYRSHIAAFFRTAVVVLIFCGTL